jgi:carboxypeptidase Q
MRVLLIAASLLLASTASAESSAPTLSPEMKSTAVEFMQLARESQLGYELVESLTTEVGPRLAGTEAEARARDWAVARLKALGFANVHVEPFDVPLWIRGLEYAEITAPFPQPLTITALGGSISTGPEGVEGEVVSFPSLAAVTAAPDNSLRGKIVFVDEVMTRTQAGSGYGVAGAKRRQTAYEAHRLGAKAALIRSVGTSSHRFAHTGQMQRAIHEPKPSVPAAALSAPDADQLQRALKRGQPVRLKLVLTPQNLPPSKSGNVVAEIIGSEAPEEIVLVGAHLDSWDLGTGAIDDGAGVGIVVGAAKLIMDHLPRAPRRTIRVVLFGSEEVGLVGAKAYADLHADELKQHIVGAESDFGAGEIWQFDTRFAEDKLSIAKEIRDVLHPLGIGPGNNEASGGPDMMFVREAGMPVVTLKQNGWDYFDLHHTPDDTLDKVDAVKLQQNIAAYAAFLYLAAEIEADFR